MCKTHLRRSMPNKLEQDARSGAAAGSQRGRAAHCAASIALRSCSVAVRPCSTLRRCSVVSRPCGDGALPALRGDSGSGRVPPNLAVLPARTQPVANRLRARLSSSADCRHRGAIPGPGRRRRIRIGACHRRESNLSPVATNSPFMRNVTQRKINPGETSGR